MNQFREREPTFTNEEKRHAIALLKKAKGNLARTQHESGTTRKQVLVCFAITVSLQTQADHDIESKLHQLIKARLGGAPTMRMWLASRGYPVLVNDPATYKRVQDTRARWIDGLIQELQPKEKRNE